MKDFTPQQLRQSIKAWGQELGFQQVGITDTNLQGPELQLQEWLKKGFHGEMAYMQRYENKRSRPGDLFPGCKSIIVARMDYLPPEASFEVLDDPEKAFVSRYAQNKDYHKLIRKRLTKLADKIKQVTGDFESRAFADSAPVMEKPLAQKAGLGWIGKHTNLINSKAGSWFFLGVLYTNLDLEIDEPQTSTHCGTCTSCIDVCPTKAIVAPFQLDAKRCVSYLTIELRTSIPVELRPLLGNRIYGCDDCQMVCPWNKFAVPATEIGFHSTRGLDAPSLIELFSWDEQTFLTKTEGSAIRRLGHECWLRNIAVALGNAPYSFEIINALNARKAYPSELVQEHVEWALQQLKLKKSS